MSQACVILSCKRSACALCHCCQQNICLPHLKEHQDLLISELNPIVDQINVFSDRLKALNVGDMISDARTKLEKWRVRSHQKIDSVFRQKCYELDQQVAEKIDKQREEISQIQSKTAELIHEQHATRHDLDWLTSTIRNLEREINKIEQTSLNIKTQSLPVDDSWITIGESSKQRFNLSNLPPVYKSIDRYRNDSPIMASNDRFLLMHQEPNLCLVDRSLTIVKQSLSDFNGICDMCYSSVLDQFILSDLDNIFLVHQTKLSIEKVLLIQGQKWYTCTCFDRSLFLSTYEYGSSIMEYSLLPSINPIEHWKPPVSCKKDEFIDHMRCNNETLALLITESNSELVHIELRTAKTLQRLWSLELDTKKVQNIRFYCCPVNNDEWLVCDYENNRLIHITGGGKIKAVCDYNPAPRYPCMFGSEILAISHDEGINFHKLEI